MTDELQIIKLWEALNDLTRRVIEIAKEVKELKAKVVEGK